MRASGSPKAQARLAQCLLEDDPEDILAMMVIAKHAESGVEYMALLREAVHVGLRVWAPCFNGHAPAPNWGTGRDAAPFISVVLAYGVGLMKEGHRDEAAECLRFLLRLDPKDICEAVRSMTEAGIVMQEHGTFDPR